MPATPSTNEAAEAQRAALEKLRLERRAALEAEAARKNEQALARKAEKERRAAETRSASREARDLRQLEKDAVVAAAAHTRSQKEQKPAGPASPSAGKPSKTKGTATSATPAASSVSAAKKPSKVVSTAGDKQPQSPDGKTGAQKAGKGTSTAAPAAIAVPAPSESTTPQPHQQQSRTRSASVTRSFDAVGAVGSPISAVDAQVGMGLVLGVGVHHSASPSPATSKPSSASGLNPRPRPIISLPSVSVTHVPDTPLSPAARKLLAGLGQASAVARDGADRPMSPAAQRAAIGASTALERMAPRVTRLSHHQSGSEASGSPDPLSGLAQSSPAPSSRRVPRTPGASALPGALSVAITDPQGSPVPNPLGSPGNLFAAAAAPSPLSFQPVANDDADLSALAARAVSLVESEDFSAALPLVLEELDLREKRYGSALDARLLPALDLAASVHEVLERPAEALPFLFQTLQVERSRAGGTPASVARSVPVSDALLRLGEALVALRAGEDAFNCFARCYLIRRDALGASHPATVQARQCVAFLTEPDFAVDELELDEIPLLQGEIEPPEPIEHRRPPISENETAAAAPPLPSAVTLQPRPASALNPSAAAATAVDSHAATADAAASAPPVPAAIPAPAPTAEPTAAAAPPVKVRIQRVANVEEELLLDVHTVQAIESRRSLTAALPAGLTLSATAATAKP